MCMTLVSLFCVILKPVNIQIRALIISCAHLNAPPLLVPVPRLDGHVIATGEHDARARVDRQASNIIRMGLESDDLLVRVVVEYAKLEVVGASDEPVLARDEAYTSDWYFSDLERLDESPCVVVVDVDRAVVETGEQPWLSGMKVDTFHAIRASEQFPLRCKSVNTCFTHLEDAYRDV